MNQIQELKFFEESEGFLYSYRIIDSFYAAVSIEKLILSIIENSQIDFLQTGGEDNSKQTQTQTQTQTQFQEYPVKLKGKNI